MNNQNQNQNMEDDTKSFFLDDERVSEGELNFDDQGESSDIIVEEDNEINQFGDGDVNYDEEKQQKTMADDAVMVSKSKLALIKKMISSVQETTMTINEMLSTVVGADDVFFGTQISTEGKNNTEDQNRTSGKIIEGVFDGDKMIGPDGKQYTIPANYSSKSKLVEGDIMKLTITDSGHFIYKQIGPVERARVIGALEKDEEGRFIVVGEREGDDSEKTWHILNASVTYFRGEVGDEVVLLVPKSGDSAWGAVENIIKKAR